MSTAGITAAPEMRIPLKGSFLPSATLQACWSSSAHGGGHQCENPFFGMDPVSTAYHLSSTAEPVLAEPTSYALGPDPGKGPSENAPTAPETFCSRLAWPPSVPCPPSSPTKRPSSNPEEPTAATILLGFGRLSASDKMPLQMPPLKSRTPQPLLAPLPAGPPGERSTRPLPPLPPAEEGHLGHDEEEEAAADREVEFLTSSDTDCLLGGGESGPSAFRPSTQGRRSFRGCGQVNYAYVEASPGPPAEQTSHGDSPKACLPLVPLVPPPPPPHQLHRRLRRSHSGPAGSFRKPATVIRVSHHFCQVSPTSDDDAKPEVPPRAPIPARALKPDYRRWSAEVTSGAYSDDDKPPKVPPREPLFQGDSRTPSPKSLPSYLHGVMPPTQSFAPDPKYVSSKALQRQQSEGALPRGPCILPIIENGRKVSSTHYYLLPERPPYLDKYEKFFQEAKDTSSPGGMEGAGGGGGGGEEGQPWKERETVVRAELGAPLKRKHFPCVVSP